MRLYAVFSEFINHVPCTVYSNQIIHNYFVNKFSPLPGFKPPTYGVRSRWPTNGPPCFCFKICLVSNIYVPLLLRLRFCCSSFIFNHSKTGLFQAWLMFSFKMTILLSRALFPNLLGFREHLLIQLNSSFFILKNYQNLSLDF